MIRLAGGGVHYFVQKNAIRLQSKWAIRMNTTQELQVIIVLRAIDSCTICVQYDFLMHARKSSISDSMLNNDASMQFERQIYG